LRAYGRLAESALALVEKGGTLVQSSCSARITAGDFVDAVELAAERSGVRLQDVTRTGHGIDHPVGFAQGEYLKAIFATVIPGR
jgi:23S rRNA (cytosine1962-C5)-methyltransferase